MSYFQRVTKDPNAVLDYQFDWSTWLAASETISTSSWTAETGITVASSSNTTTTATVWLSGGTVAQTFNVVNHITTNQGRTEDRTLCVEVKER